MLELFKIIVIMEWIAFIFLIIGCLIFVCLLHYSDMYKRYLKESGRLEKMEKVIIVFQKIRMKAIFLIGMIIIIFFILWHLAINYTNMPLTNSLLLSQFYLFTILGLFPIPIAFMIFEFCLKIYLKKMKNL